MHLLQLGILTACTFHYTLKFTAVVTKVIPVNGILPKIFILTPTATTVQKLWYYISTSQYFGTYKVERQTDMTTTAYVLFLQKNIQKQYK